MKFLRRFFASLFAGFGLFKALTPVWSAFRKAWSARPLRSFVSRVVFFAVGLFWIVIRWFGRFNLRLFLQGLPALAVGIAAVTVSIIAFFTPAQELEARYVDQAKNAARAKNHAEAVACYERLAQLQSDRPDVVYEMALAADAAGQSDRCILLMQQLAPPDKLGHAKAHLWNGVRLLSRSYEALQNRQLAESHLLRALEAGIEDKEAAHTFLGDLNLAKGQFNEAETHFLIAVKTKPHVRLRLAHLYTLQGNRTRAKAEAQAAANWYSAITKGDLFAHYARLKWVEATLLLEDFPQAVVILEEGLSGTGEDLYRRELAGVHAMWFDFLTRSRNPNPAERIAKLERGLQYDPKNLALLNRVFVVAGTKSGDLESPSSAAGIVSWGACFGGPQLACTVFCHRQAEAEAARKTLRELLAKGPTAAIHFFLGVDAWDNGRVKEAQIHWERALQLAPDTPVLANNLAWLIYQTDEANLSKALDLSNLAIEKTPGQTNFRDTRGHILIKMGKFKEALPDLEAALPRSPNRLGLHRALAEVYTRLELPAVAAEHERLAQELTPKKEAR